MPYFDRFDIAHAYALIEYNYNVGGIVRERPSNERRNMSTGFQLHRMNFRPSRLFKWTVEDLNQNARAIYYEQVKKYDLPVENDDIERANALMEREGLALGGNDGRWNVTGPSPVNAAGPFEKQHDVARYVLANYIG